jgi:hypothetical protein
MAFTGANADYSAFAEYSTCVNNQCQSTLQRCLEIDSNCVAYLNSFGVCQQNSAVCQLSVTNQLYKSQQVKCVEDCMDSGDGSAWQGYTSCLITCYSGMLNFVLFKVIFLASIVLAIAF